MDYVKKELRKIGSMVLMILAMAIPFGWEISLMGIGLFLCVEHVYTYNRNNFWDFAGHEWIGLILFVIGARNWLIIPFIIGWLIMADFTYFNPYKYLMLKARSLK